MLFPILTWSPNAYVENELRWRAGEEKAIRAEEGWLAVAGLHWLTKETSTFGSGASCDVKLSGVANLVGMFTRTGSDVYFSPEDGVKSIVDGRWTTGIVEMRSDSDAHPSRLVVNGKVVTVIRRGKRFGLRVYDPANARRRAFRGLRWYPVDARYRIVARFVPYAKPKTLWITNVLGDVRSAPSPGYADFRLKGRTLRLDAEDHGSSYFFNFGDGTNNRTTYGAGRFLDAAKPKGGTITLDFNRATNPPCAFTDFATCPLPPKQNHLSIEIPAGALNDPTKR